MNLKVLCLIPVLALGACSANLGGLVGINPTVSSQNATVVINSFDALEAAATGYIQLPLCGSAGAPLTCRNQAAAVSIKKAVLTGRTARTKIEDAIAANGGGKIPLATMNTLQSAIATLQAIYTQYNIQH